MFALYDSLVGYFDAHPGKGFFASAGIGVLHLMGRAAIFSAHFVAQVSPVTPTSVIWAGYVTVYATAAGAVFAGLIQMTRLFRAARGDDSRPPFERKKRKQHNEHY